MTDYTKGVIHTTMHMPSSCSMCWINKSCEEHANEWRKPWKGYDKRLDTCPLQPVRHGRWELDKENDSFFCSECNAEALLKYIVIGGALQELSDYCPNCGARMDGDEE